MQGQILFSSRRFPKSIFLFVLSYMLSGFEGLTDVIIVMDIVSTILELSTPLYCIYAIITINIYELAINVDGGIMLRSYNRNHEADVFERPAL